MEFFKILHTSSKSKARRGVITTDHGIVQTPAFVPVGTKATIKGVMPQLLEATQTQIAFVNTYHLVTHPGTDIIKAHQGVHNFSQLNIPLMSDSGGFQVFSLAQKKYAKLRGDAEDSLVIKINENGVLFRSVYDGKDILLNPATSMQHQKEIGADLLMAFDECTPQNGTHEYAKASMERTHRWLHQCVKAKKALDLAHQTHTQYLYGIIQGASFKDLREESAAFIANANTPGIAIGGVAVGEGKEEMRNQVSWVAPYLPSDKPVHLLGVGFIEDIIDLVSHGIDTFDCVEPTRMGREGRLLILDKVLSKIQENDGKQDYYIDITSNIYKNDMSIIDASSNFIYSKDYSRAYVHHLFKQKELLGYSIVTMHNLFVMSKLMEQIRQNIENDLM
jgi:queuine tRNA-ribosyltransferase